MLFCPFCKARNELHNDVCIRCNRDISILSNINSIPRYYFNRGLELIKEDNIPEAILCFSTSLSMEPKSVLYMKTIAKAYVAAGAYDLALHFLGRIPEKDKAEDVMGMIGALESQSKEETVERGN